MPGTRSFATGSFALHLDGVSCGFLKAVDGGDISAEVISEPQGSAQFIKKHIGPPKYEDFQLQFGFGMSKVLYDWIAASWKQNYARKNGSIVSTDFKLTPISERQFTNALITETTIPPLDASAKDPAFLTVKFSPEYTRTAKASGTAGKVVADKQKVFLPSNFRLEIDGLDCSKVNKVDALTVKQTVSTDDIGDARDYTKEPGKLEFPNLKITLAAVSAPTWNAWFEDFVVKGNNGDSNEKSGAIVLLAPDRKAELARITLHNLGIFALRHQRQVANDEAVQRLTAELYCEQMELKVGAAAAAVKTVQTASRSVVPPAPVSTLRPDRPAEPMR
jgi:phage tail-like protein